VTWDCVVGIVSRLWAGQSRNCGAISGGDKMAYFTVPRCVQTSLRSGQLSDQWVLGTSCRQKVARV
jgi:hypothetical protein